MQWSHGLRPPPESLKVAGAGREQQCRAPWNCERGAAPLPAPLGQQTPGGEFIRHSTPIWAPGDRNLRQAQCPWAPAPPPSPSPLVTPQNELIWIWGPFPPQSGTEDSLACGAQHSREERPSPSQEPSQAGRHGTGWAPAMLHLSQSGDRVRGPWGACLVSCPRAGVVSGEEGVALQNHADHGQPGPAD